MLSQKQLNTIFIIVTMLSLVFCGLGSYIIWPAPLMVFYCLGLMGFVFLVILIKRKRWIKSGHGVFKNKKLFCVAKTLLNLFLITMLFLGPRFFCLGFTMAIGGNSLLFFLFGTMCAGPLGAISGLTFLIINIETFKKPVAWLGLLPLLFLVLVNLYCFLPVYHYVKFFYDVNLVEFIYNFYCFNLDKLWTFITGG
ncbi:MAG: hypothetical protein IJG60_04930 [Thermoguttaceae bacterium]|nr:hypothetical protein [Thermoguttaceae bacterium]